MRSQVVKVELITPAAPRPRGPYSQGVLASGTLVFVSGQTGVHPRLDRIVDGTIQGQTSQVFDNIEAILVAAGLGLGDVVRVAVFLRDLDDFEDMNAIYRSRFESPYPARTTVQVRLPDSALIEIEVIAVLSEGRLLAK